MDHLSALPPLSWSQQLRSQMQSRPLTALGLFIALAAVLLLLLQSLIMLATGEVTSGVRYGLVGGAAGFAATAIGALPALFLRSVPQKVEDTMLGFAGRHDAGGQCLLPAAAGAGGRRGDHWQRLQCRRRGGGRHDPRGAADAGTGSVHPPRA